ncbi:MAG: dihydroorotase [bacterium]|nr:dihydroorotase [bacterium]
MLLIRGGEVFDADSGVLKRTDILVGDDGLIAVIGPDLEAGPGMEIFEADGLAVVPGLIDMHVHLREPGFVNKEDIRSGLEAAAAGGFTAVMAMPNTSPVCDNGAIVRYMYDKASGVDGARLMVCGSISKGLQGKELALMGEMVEAGAVAVSDDGRTVMNAELMRLALQYAGRFDLPVITHCLDEELAGGGAMHLGPVSLRLGLRGIPGSAEDIIVVRDILLAEEIGARLHIAHVSTLRSAELVRQAARRGCRVTAEVTPHHLTLTDEAVEGYDTSTKVSPPLRSEADRVAMIKALNDGTVGVIATDHAPHTVEEKAVEYDLAPFGLIGLETALPVLLTLVHSGTVSLECLLTAMSAGPAAALGVTGGRLATGLPADITVIDLNEEHTIDPASFRSMARNTPFAGWKVKGRAAATIVGGKVVFRR